MSTSNNGKQVEECLVAPKIHFITSLFAQCSLCLSHHITFPVPVIQAEYTYYRINCSGSSKLLPNYWSAFRTIESSHLICTIMRTIYMLIRKFRITIIKKNHVILVTLPQHHLPLHLSHTASHHDLINLYKTYPGCTWDPLKDWEGQRDTLKLWLFRRLYLCQ
jgi:hypothetical protein